MNDAQVVSGAESVRQLQTDRPEALERHARVGNVLGEGRAQDQLHGQEVAPFAVLDIEDRHHAGVAYRCQCLGFPLEARKAIRILRNLLRQQLERHVSLQAGVVSAVDLAHAPLAEQLDQPVVAERVTEPQRCSLVRLGPRLAQEPLLDRRPGFAIVSPEHGFDLVPQFRVVAGSLEKRVAREQRQLDSLQKQTLDLCPPRRIGHRSPGRAAVGSADALLPLQQDRQVAWHVGSSSLVGRFMWSRRERRARGLDGRLDVNAPRVSADPARAELCARGQR